MKNPFAQRLATLEEYPKKPEVISLKNEFMGRLNRIGFTSGAGVSIVNFVEKAYFPAIEVGGWHANRFGLATNLHKLGVRDKVIQAILRMKMSAQRRGATPRRCLKS
jgi:hypothetical protein